MSLKAIIEQDLLVIQADFGNPVFTFAGTDYPCHPGSGGSELILGQGGYEQVADLVLVVRAIDIADITLRAQNVITYNSKVYRIAKLIESPTQAFYRVVCVSNTRGV